MRVLAQRVERPAPGDGEQTDLSGVKREKKGRGTGAQWCTEKGALPAGGVSRSREHLGEVPTEGSRLGSSGGV